MSEQSKKSTKSVKSMQPDKAEARNKGGRPAIVIKNREFSQNHPLIRPVGPSNSLVSLVFSVEFPKHRNREFF